MRRDACVETTVRRSPDGRRGVTLIELLVVIALLVMITAVTIPAVAPSIQQRRQREAARLVSSYISAARSRAMEIGRSVGVVIQRFNPGQASSSGGGGSGTLQPYSMSLSIAEAPPPYAGDATNSTVKVTTSSTYMGQLSVVFTDNWTAQSIRVGDGIRFNFQGPIYYFDSYNTTATGSTVITGGSPWTVGPLAQVQEHLLTTLKIDSGDIWFTNQVVMAPLALQSGTVAVPYQIFRQPATSSAVAPLQVPEGIVIDLTRSGMSSETGGIFLGASNPIISFTPTGRVDMVYDGLPLRATGSIFLLLGRPEQVNLAATTNLADPNSLWVAIGYQSGHVLTAENYANNGGVIATARQLASGALAGQSVSTLGGN